MSIDLVYTSPAFTPRGRAGSATLPVPELGDAWGCSTLPLPTPGTTPGRDGHTFLLPDSVVTHTCAALLNK